MEALFAYVSANSGIIATILFLVSELLASIPSVKANSIFQLIANFIRGRAKKELPEIEKQLNADSH